MSRSRTKQPSPFDHDRSEVWERAQLVRAIQREQVRLGERLHALREAKDLSQEAAAEAIGIHPRQVRRLEHGEANVTLATLVAIAHAYGVQVHELLAPEPKGAGQPTRAGSQKKTPVVSPAPPRSGARSTPRPCRSRDRR